MAIKFSLLILLCLLYHFSLLHQLRNCTTTKWDAWCSYKHCTIIIVIKKWQDISLEVQPPPCKQLGWFSYVCSLLKCLFSRKKGIWLTIHHWQSCGASQPLNAMLKLSFTFQSSQAACSLMWKNQASITVLYWLSITCYIHMFKTICHLYMVIT